MRPKAIWLAPAIYAAVLMPAPAIGQSQPSGVVRSSCETQGAWRPGQAALSTYIDSALVATALRPSWRPEWNRVVATLAAPPDSIGSEDRVWVGTRAPDTESLEAIGAWLLEARTDTPLPERTNVAVLIGDEGVFRLRGVRLTSCEPLLASRERVADAMRDLGREFRQVFAARELEVARLVVWMHVDEQGEVDEIEVNEPSLLPELDREVIEAFRRYARFDPARREGIPLGAWVSMPVSVRPAR